MTPELIRLFEWLYTLQSVIGIGLSLFASWDAYQDLVAAHGGLYERLHRLIVLQAYALAGALGILHVLLLWLGLQALLGPLPPPVRQPFTLHVVEVFVGAQFIAILLQGMVAHLRRRVRTWQPPTEGPS